MKSTGRNSRQAIEKAWDRLADEYTRAIGPAGNRSALAAVELAVVERELPGDAVCRILDAGCGPGYHAVRLPQRSHRVTLVDVSSRMLAIAREAADCAGVGDRIATVKADIRAMDVLPREFFDLLVACGTVVSDCGAPREALAEFARVLRPCGKACVSVRALGAAEQTELTRVVPGHSAFDWHLFSPRGIAEACGEAGLSWLRTVPVGCEPPPEVGTPESIREYVTLHLDATDSPAALSRAVEMMAVAVKPA